MAEHKSDTSRFCSIRILTLSYCNKVEDRISQFNLDCRIMHPMDLILHEIGKYTRNGISTHRDFSENVQNIFWMKLDVHYDAEMTGERLNRSPVNERLNNDQITI